jgi:hypothetical protein
VGAPTSQLYGPSRLVTGTAIHFYTILDGNLRRSVGRRGIGEKLVLTFILRTLNIRYVAQDMNQWLVLVDSVMKVRLR